MGKFDAYSSVCGTRVVILGTRLTFSPRSAPQVDHEYLDIWNNSRHALSSRIQFLMSELAPSSCTTYMAIESSEQKIINTFSTHVQRNDRLNEYHVKEHSRPR